MAFSQFLKFKECFNACNKTQGECNCVEVWEAGAVVKWRKWSGLVMAVTALLAGTVIMPVY